jgi:hypothetical protein
MSENGVKLAIAAAKAAQPTRTPHNVIADLLSRHGAPITANAIYNFEAKGYFPPDRAKVIAEEYSIPLEKLINPRFGSLLDAR